MSPNPKIVMLLGLGFVSLIVDGCKDSGENAARQVSQGAVQSTENLKQAAESMANAIKVVDPTGIRTEIDKNEKLRGDIEALRKYLNGLGSIGGVVEVGPNQRIYFQITGHRGSVNIVEAYVDNPNAWFMRNKTTPDTSVELPIAHSYATNIVENTAKQIVEAFNKNPLVKIKWEDWARDINTIAVPFSQQMRTVRVDIDNTYAAAITKGFTDFLNAPYQVPTGDIATTWAVDKNLQLKEGAHTVYIRVRPVKTDEKTHDWSVDTRVWAVGGDNVVSELNKITVDTSNAKTIDGKQPVAMKQESAPIEVGQVYVKFTDSPASPKAK